MYFIFLYCFLQFICVRLTRDLINATCLLTVSCQRSSVIIIIVTRSVYPEPPAVAIVRQNGLSSASCRASAALSIDNNHADLHNYSRAVFD